MKRWVKEGRRRRRGRESLVSREEVRSRKMRGYDYGGKKRRRRKKELG